MTGKNVVIAAKLALTYQVFYTTIAKMAQEQLMKQGVPLTGNELLKSPLLNKGATFSVTERIELVLRQLCRDGIASREVVRC